jgi:hypothetical protein
LTPFGPATATLDGKRVANLESIRAFFFKCPTPVCLIPPQSILSTL